ncbi:hypothetical protein EJ04DRAFT_522942 [Polyplosphaeria fusca]|uniref:Integrase catalytic domain-containing protein n=1 Tax=Polyplosphaeria fusca TaxID=682080 RepID=A0A9P4R1G8_9PLEO|nr:hypothetical protein EJ04DRAFT_522942 [Polyplosphaeria fusca]
MCIPDRTALTILEAVKRFVRKVYKVFGQTIVAFRYDNECGFNDWIRLAACKGYKLEPCPADTPQPGSGIERAGHTIVLRARAMSIDSGLPREQLAAEMTIAAINILNCTPTVKLDWQCPHFMLHGSKPSVAHFELIGAKAYTLDKHIPRGDKLASRDLQEHPATTEELLEAVLLPDEAAPTDAELAIALLPRMQANQEGATPSAPLVLDEDEEELETDVVPTIEEPELLEKDDEQGAGRAYLTPFSPARDLPSDHSTPIPTPTFSRASSRMRKSTQDLPPTEDEETFPGDLTEEAPPTPAVTNLGGVGKKKASTQMMKGWATIPAGAEAPDQKRNNAPKRGPHPDAAKKKGLLKGMDDGMLLSAPDSARSTRRSKPQPEAHAVYFGTFAACLDPSKNLNTEPSVTKIHRS